MIKHNLCKSTLVRDITKHQCDGVLAHDVGEGRMIHFTTKNKGILPVMLTELLQLRKSVKRQMTQVDRDIESGGLDAAALETMQRLYTVLDKRQLAVKISANSVYGFQGAQCGQYSSREAAETTTAIGRQMLMQANEISQKCAQTLTKADGSPVGAYRLVYGDTDSLMFTLSNATDPQDACDAASVIADEVTRVLDAKLEFEKAYFPMCLFSKKKYIGMLWNLNYEGRATKRGVSSSGTANKRRDSCTFVQRLYNAMVDAILNECDRSKCMRVFDQHMTDLIHRRIDIEDFQVTKSVRSEFAFPGLKWAIHSASTSDLSSMNSVAKLVNVMQRKVRQMQLLGTPIVGAIVELTKHDLSNAGVSKLTTASYVRVTAKPGLEVVMLPVVETLAHMRVVEKQRARNPGSETRAGNRLSMVYIEGNDKSKARDITEDYEYARQHNLKLNIPYYIEHQISTPISQLLALLHPDPASVMQKYVALFRRLNEKSSIDRFFSHAGPSTATANTQEQITDTTQAAKDRARAQAAKDRARAQKRPASSVGDIRKWTSKASR